jgi:hypothetical protein
LEYQKCIVGLDVILVKCWEISNSKEITSERDRLQALSIGIEAYRMKLDLITNATVVQRAVDFVDRHRGFIRQNSKLVTDDSTEPRQDTR